ncbi:MAG: mechanosensitive ion channel protein [Rhodothermaceae bacterium]|nr:MAG: mechanosensitive ion channel protein [Rhodothermaceae bacterium]
MNLSDALSRITNKLIGWLEALIALLPNLVLAVLVAIGFGLLARYGRRLTYRLLDRVSANRQVNRLLGSIVSVAVVAAGIFIALSILHLEDVVTALLAGVGIVGLALGFAFQDIVSNFVSGILLAFRRPFREGHYVEASGVSGTVEEVNLRTTIIRRTDGARVYVPNREVFGHQIVNYCEPGFRRVDVACGVAYGDDLEKAREVALEAVEDLPGRAKDRPLELFYESFGDSSINFVLRFWIPFQGPRDLFEARSAAIRRIKRAFDAHGITIPFPIRTLDFGVVGGVKLAEALPKAWVEGGRETPAAGNGEAA